MAAVQALHQADDAAEAASFKLYRGKKQVADGQGVVVGRAVYRSDRKASQLHFEKQASSVELVHPGLLAWELALVKSSPLPKVPDLAGAEVIL